jgi:CheY-like chemotaxis protein
MTLPLRNLIRGLFFDGPTNNGTRNVFAREREPDVFSRKTHRSAKVIFFVDDEPSILSMRRLMFEALGHPVFTAASGEEALKAFVMYPVDAVVLDYLMPGMDGEETARCMRKVRSEIPIILSSGCLDVPERVLEVVNAAVDKSEEPEPLIEAVAQQLALGSTPNSLVSIKAETQGWHALG